MKIAIRTDASSVIGTGHVMRCLVLAEELRARGAFVVFVCRSHYGNLCDLISYRGFGVYRLGLHQEAAEYKGVFNGDNLEHSAWLGVEQDVDAIQTKSALGTIAHWDWLIVDHYALDFRWETIMRPMVGKIMVIDDLADRFHECELLIDQNYYPEHMGNRYERLVPKNCDILLGPQYALLRSEVRQARKFCNMRGNGISRVLVYFGGTDLQKLTIAALNAMSIKELQHLLVEVVVGANTPCLDEIEAQVHNRPGTRLHIQPISFIELMLRADLCIGACGTNTWERIFLRLPSIVITVAKNQETIAQGLDKACFLKWLGNQDTISSEKIQEHIIQHLMDPENKMDSLYKYHLVDGFGVLRVVEKLYPSNTQNATLRRATSEDIGLYFCWANDTTVRENSLQEERIPWNEHVQWFSKKINSSHTWMWVLQTSNGLPLGQIRFDKRDGILSVSYSLDKLARGRGWGKRLLELGCEKIALRNNNEIIQAKVKIGNTPSINIFRNLGFSQVDADGICIFSKVLKASG